MVVEIHRSVSHRTLWLDYPSCDPVMIVKMDKLARAYLTVHSSSRLHRVTYLVNLLRYYLLLSNVHKSELRKDVGYRSIQGFI